MFNNHSDFDLLLPADMFIAKVKGPLCDFWGFFILYLVLILCIHCNLLRTSANDEWVEFSHDGDCSFAGVYQPPLPKKSKEVDQFIATSNYANISAVLKLGTRVSVAHLGDEAKSLCHLDWQSLNDYNHNHSVPVTNEYELAQYCFRSVFAFQMLCNEYRFSDDFVITAVDVLRGQKLGWALGSILYEINTREYGGLRLAVSASPWCLSHFLHTTLELNHQFLGNFILN
jgi:hypothetical protein